MTTITLQVTEEQARRLSEEAARAQLSVEELAVRRLFDAAVDDISDEEFDAMARQVIFDHEVLLRRLA